VKPRVGGQSAEKLILASPKAQQPHDGENHDRNAPGNHRVIQPHQIAPLLMPGFANRVPKIQFGQRL
jgi:hypothetical protein